MTVMPRESGASSNRRPELICEDSGYWIVRFRGR